jgi:hypothetical protein
MTPVQGGDNLYYIDEFLWQGQLVTAFFGFAFDHTITQESFQAATELKSEDATSFR